jgi:TRAP-type C4-dicarboxylate transport system permease small subunit
MTRLSLIFGKLFDALAVTAALILLAMVVTVTADIVLRNTMRTGIVWANEVSEYSLYLMTLLTAPWLLRRGQHVRIDLVIGAVPARVASLMEAASDVLGIFVCLVFVRYGIVMTLESFRLGAITIKNLVFPEWWLLAPLPFFFLLLAIEFLFRLHRVFVGDDSLPAKAAPTG